MHKGEANTFVPGDSGFTLAEMMVGLVVMGIIAAIAIPNWHSLRPGYELDSSTRQIQSELHYLKIRAASENVGFQLAYLEGVSEYLVQREAVAVAAKPLPEGVVITKAGTISFSPRGTAGSNRVRLRHVAGLCKQIVVSATGRVRVCKPADCSTDC
jgi:prepilin-type N-terminal cleavage/methylation domain-containing protein